MSKNITDDFKLHASDTKAIRELADVMSEKDLTDLEFERGETCIRLSRGGQMLAAAPVAAAPVAAAPAAPVVEAAPAITVDAPMVGTFYHSADPDAPAFIKVGDTIKQGQVIGIIEAMKTMNQIEADKGGVVADILVENGSPVAFGQRLVALK